MKQSRTLSVMFLSLGQGLSTVVILVVSMVMARVLTQTELATYQQTLLAYQVAVPLLSLGLSKGIYYFLPTEKSRVRGIVVDALIMSIVMGMVYAILIALGGNHLLARRFSNPAIAETLLYMIPLPLVMLPAGLVSSVLVVQNRASMVSVYNVISNVCIGIALISAGWYWKSPEETIIVKVVVSMISGFVGIVLIFRVLPKDEWYPRLNSMKKMVAISLPLVIAGTLGTISRQLDRIIVSALCSPEEFAVYAIGAFEVPVVGIVTGSIASVILPDMRKYAVELKGVEALRLFQLAAQKSAVVIFPIMFFLMVSAEPLIKILFSEKYAASVIPFRMYLCILPIRIVFFGSFLTAFGKTKTILLRSTVGLIVNGVLSVVLVKTVGYNGVVVGTIFSIYFVEVLWSLISIGKIAGCSWWKALPLLSLMKVMGIALAAAVPVFILNVLFSGLNNIWGFVANLIIYVLFQLMIVYMINDKLYKSEIKLYKNKVMKIINR